MQTNPGSSEEFIEDVILFSVTVEESGADDVDSELVVVLGESECSHFNLFQLLVLWQRYSRIEISIAVGSTISLTWGVAPCHGR